MSIETAELTKLANLNPHIDRYLVHLYQQLSRDRLMLVLGAGVSAKAGVPQWKALLERLRDHVQKKEKAKLFQGTSLTFNAQLLRDALLGRKYSSANQFTVSHLQVTQDWFDVVHAAIYKDTPSDISEVIQNHPYIRALGEVALRVPYSLSFNFDDLLWEVMMRLATDHRDKNHSAAIRQPNIIWRPQVTEHTRAATIFHVNGRLPHSPLGKRSEEIVFTEDSFADAYLSVNTPLFEQHVYKMSNYTQLIIGHSLEDASLRNILRTMRGRTPANVGYYIYYVSGEITLSKSQREDIFRINLEIYNIITMFAEDKDIDVLLRSLAVTADEFAEAIRCYEGANAAYRYYVVGAVGAGKTTTLENLRHFETYEEWPSSIPPEMYLRSDDERKDEWKGKIDSSVDRSVGIKNRFLRNQIVGFFFMDRGPFDSVAFEESKGGPTMRWNHVYKLLGSDFQPGEICFLLAGGKECEVRNIRRGRPTTKAGDAKYFARQEQRLMNVYGTKKSDAYKSSAGSSGAVAREITLGALLGEYRPWTPRSRAPRDNFD